MPPTAVFLLLLSWPLLASASTYPRGHPPSPLLRRDSNSRSVPPQGFYDPRSHGGSFLTQVNDTFPPGLGEPINVILLGSSDSAVLVDQQQDGGLRNYYLSLGFAGECLGQHAGGDQEANVGDGRGYQNETAVMRWDYGNPTLGTCQETIEGGNHFRYWPQTGGEANSGAIFMALSYELPDALQHDIIFNGYNLARDWLVGNATAQSSIIPTANVTNTTTYSGQTSFGGYVYQTDVQYVSGFLSNTSDGINHFASVGANGTSATDGLVALLNVKILTSPQGSSKKSSAQPSAWPPLLPSLVAFLALFASILA
ncbi:hypothetical protein BC834DRAFT_864426 [Gloeopeniophorella convolvens]|nr:hypothetical protein BC834DRAFT_864426 [Gloeopeniophorella convolvens]